MVTVSSGRVRNGRSIATWRVPRTRGAASGILLVLLGAWGALVPFVGPHFNFAYTPNSTWTVTEGRLWLEVLPGAVAFLGGLILVAATSRAIGLWAGWLTAVAGAWFVVGPVVSKLWANGQTQAGAPVGGSTLRAVVEELAFFSGLGVVILFLAATALGRFSVIGVRDAEVAAAQLAADEPVVDEGEPVATDVDNEPRHAAETVTTTRKPLIGRNTTTTTDDANVADDTVVTEKPVSAREAKAARRDEAESVDDTEGTGRIPVQTATERKSVVAEKSTKD
jgi:hypothetical protein